MATMRLPLWNQSVQRALAEKLLTYASGGAPAKSDKPEIDAIVARLGAKNYGFRTLVHEIVQSKVIQTK